MFPRAWKGSPRQDLSGLSPLSRSMTPGSRPVVKQPDPRRVTAVPPAAGTSSPTALRRPSMPPLTVAVIPARYRSTRLPGKALADIGGRPMVCHVAQRALRARGIARVIVATDDARIRDAVAGIGVEAVLTSPEHASGTDRLAEVARGLEADVLLNLQGDLPLLDPSMVEALADRMAAQPTLPMATVATALHDETEWRSPHVVKVVV